MRINPKLSYARLDYFLISSSLSNQIVGVQHRPGFATDHSMVVLTLTTTLPRRGQGFWKLNCKHLDDKQYVEGVILVIEKVEQKYKGFRQSLKMADDQN